PRAARCLERAPTRPRPARRCSCADDDAEGASADIHRTLPSRRPPAAAHALRSTTHTTASGARSPPAHPRTDAAQTAAALPAGARASARIVPPAYRYRGEPIFAGTPGQTRAWCRGVPRTEWYGP